MRDPELVVLAAGIGSRYGGLKQIEPVGPDGEIIIDYSIYDALRQGFGRVIFVIRKDIADVFRETIGHRFESCLEVAYVFQEMDDLPEGFTPPAERVKPWGTGQALFAARNAVQGVFAVINADDFYGMNSFETVAKALSVASGRTSAIPRYYLIGFPLKNTLSDFGHVSRGICTLDDDNRLCRIEELTHIERKGKSAVHREPDGKRTVSLSGNELVSMNMWGFSPELFPALNDQFRSFLAENGSDLKAEFYLPAAVDQLIQTQEAECLVLPTDSPWAGVTYKEDRAVLQNLITDQISKGVYPSPLWSGK